MPSAVSVRSRREAARRDAARRTSVRRRRYLMAIGALAVLAYGVSLMMPVVKRAVNSFALPLAYSGVIREQAAEKHLDPSLIAAVIYAETKFDPRASAAGAEGLMQILPQTATFLAHRSGATTFTTADLATPAVNIAYGSYYLRYLMDQYRGNSTLALAAYNGGEANVDRWLAQAHSRGEAFGVDQIPFPETRAYVQKVLIAQQEYRHTYPTQLGYR